MENPPESQPFGEVTPSRKQTDEIFRLHLKWLQVFWVDHSLDHPISWKSSKTVYDLFGLIISSSGHFIGNAVKADKAFT